VAEARWTKGDFSFQIQRCGRSCLTSNELQSTARWKANEYAQQLSYRSWCFAATPYGALLAFFFMGTAFGFMAFLGLASLVGVSVSHVIVLFSAHL
jgi:hypothetical protein